MITNKESEKKYECEKCTCMGCMRGDSCRCDDVTCGGRAKPICDKKIDA